MGFSNVSFADDALGSSPASLEVEIGSFQVVNDPVIGAERARHRAVYGGPNDVPAA